MVLTIFFSKSSHDAHGTLLHQDVYKMRTVPGKTEAETCEKNSHARKMKKTLLAVPIFTELFP